MLLQTVVVPQNCVPRLKRFCISNYHFLGDAIVARLLNVTI